MKFRFNIFLFCIYDFWFVIIDLLENYVKFKYIWDEDPSNNINEIIDY